MKYRDQIVSLFCLVSLFVSATIPRVASADQPATEPATSPSDAALAHADEVLEAASKDLDSGKLDDALAEYRIASDLYLKAQGTPETTEHAACLNGEGLCLQQLGRSADALPIFKAALGICQRLHKDQDDSDVATAMVNLASCLANLDRNEEALSLDRSALEMRQRLNKGNDALEVAASMTSVATRLAVLDRNEQALPLFQKSLEIRRRLHTAENDAGMAGAYVSVGNCLQDLGRPADALPNFQLALEMKKRLNNGEDDPDIANTQTSVGVCHFNLGHYDDALKIFQSTLEMRRRICKGKDQSDLVTSMNNVAKCLDALGHSSDALTLYQSALEMTRRICKNQDDPQLAAVMDNVAACMESLGRGEEALVVFLSSLEMRQRIYKGRDDIDVAASLNDTATCLAFLGRFEDALGKFQAAHALLNRIHKDKDSADVAATLANMASCLDSLGRCAEALPEHEAALEMRRRLYQGADHPDIAGSLNNQAVCFTSLGRFDDALSAQEASLEMWMRLYKNADHPDVATALSNVALTLDNLRRSDKALSKYKAALEMRRRLNGKQDHPSIAINLALMGGCLISLDRPAEALPYCRDALEMQQRIYKGRDHPMVAWNMAKVATCLASMGRRPDALPMFQKAVAMSERLSNADLYRYSSNLGDCLLNMGKLAEAAAAYDKSIIAFERARAALGGDDQDKMKFMDAQDDCDAFVAMVRVQLKLNHPEKAAEYLDRGRGRSLLDVLERAERRTGGDLLTSLKARAAASHDTQLSQQLEDAGSAIAAADQRVRELTTQINFARSLNSEDGNARIDQLQPKLDDACQKYAEAHRRFFNVAGTTTFTEPAAASQIQSLLKPHQHLLMYSITDRDAAIILIPPRGQPISGALLMDPDQKKLLSGVELTRLMVGYQQSIVQHKQDSTRGVKLVDNNPPATRPTDEMTRNGFELFSRLMPPGIWQQIKDDDLVYVIPDAGMNGLPLETLVIRKPLTPNARDCQYWLDQGPSICYAASATALLKLCTQPRALGASRNYAHQAVLLGDPVFKREAKESPKSSTRPATQTRNASLGAYGPLTPLPGTRKEITGIYEKLAGRPYTGQKDDSIVVLLGEDATEARLADAAVGTRYLHLATHGLARSGKDSIYSSIVLTQPRVVTTQDTGLLTLQDLFDHWGGKLAGTEMVVLSACDSQGIDQSKSNAVTDEGVFGLPWGFWYAGAPAVVASLWEVQDDSTARLMEQFYRNLQSSSSTTGKLAAFTAARKQLRGEYPEPFYWAPFIYLGNPN